jgi:hypothetical protein
MASVWGDRLALRSLQMQNGVPWIWLSAAGGLAALRDIDLYDEALGDMMDPSDFALDFENGDLVSQLQWLLSASGKTDMLKMAMVRQSLSETTGASRRPAGKRE